ncbi:hypothetical protein [Rhizobium rhizophilum]|uniref:Invasion associated locus B family protein n=1 Tax=Rhizobium rhizophilum TaxID=1850373 RepID=A0ABY2QYC0_9HYPH|nr:hypothetical protein [Rhizobium rhizophilum]THV16617.1 hypothetical protein E9677_01015 [Rhizobium rhizophilum]
MKIIRLSSLSALSAFVLLAAPLPSFAEEELTWHAWSGEGAASLVYGMAESDYVLLSLACESADGPVMLFFPYEPAGAQDGSAYRLTLENGSQALTTETTGSRMEMDDLFMLEGRLPRGEELKGLLGGTGVLKVSVGKDVTELPLASAGNAAREFLAVCAP